MKRALILVLALCLLSLVSSNLFSQEKTKAGDEKPWFDMENCAFCKSLLAEEGLMEHIDFEYHHIPNGVVSVTVVDDDYHDAYMRAQEAMNETAAEIGKTGKMPYMCGHCEAYGTFMMAGVDMQYVQGDLADVLIMTSDDPGMVEKMHAFADRTMEEMGKMAANE